MYIFLSICLIYDTFDKKNSFINLYIFIAPESKQKRWNEWNSDIFFAIFCLVNMQLFFFSSDNFTTAHTLLSHARVLFSVMHTGSYHCDYLSANSCSFFFSFPNPDRAIHHYGAAFVSFSSQTPEFDPYQIIYSYSVLTLLTASVSLFAFCVVSETCSIFVLCFLRNPVAVSRPAVIAHTLIPHGSSFSYPIYLLPLIKTYIHWLLPHTFSYILLLFLSLPPLHLMHRPFFFILLQSCTCLQALIVLFVLYNSYTSIACSEHVAHTRFFCRLAT